MTLRKEIQLSEGTPLVIVEGFSPPREVVNYLDVSSSSIRNLLGNLSFCATSIRESHHALSTSENFIGGSGTTQFRSSREAIEDLVAPDPRISFRHISRCSGANFMGDGISSTDRERSRHFSKPEVVLIFESFPLRPASSLEFSYFFILLNPLLNSTQDHLMLYSFPFRSYRCSLSRFKVRFSISASAHCPSDFSRCTPWSSSQVVK